ncbi:MAG: glycerol-3-phosphate dehydrogenase C-terminal domain-containing protein, partial [bacterium]
DAEDVSYLLHAVNEAFENLHLSPDDVVSTWAGLRPLVNEEGKPSSVSRDYEIVATDTGLVTIAGGKLTTYRSMAEVLLDEILSRFADRFERQFSECQTASQPLYGGEIADFEKYLAAELKGIGNAWGLSSKIVKRLLYHYGTDYLKILALGLVDRDFLLPLSTEPALTAALKGEVIYAVEEEMAMTLDDFMERRTDLKHFSPEQGRNIAAEVANLMGQQLQWTGQEKQQQLEAYCHGVEKIIAFPKAEVSVGKPRDRSLLKTKQPRAIKSC